MTLNDANLLERRDLHMHVLYLFKTHYIFFTQEHKKIGHFQFMYCMYEAEAIRKTDIHTPRFGNMRISYRLPETSRMLM